MPHFVIIGTGVAGISAIEAIRSVDPRSKISLVGDDPFGYYSRPGLAYYLTGEIPEEMLYPFSKDELTGFGIQPIKAQVTRINIATQQLELTSGKTLSFDKLLLAVGARAHRPNLPGMDLQGVVTLDDLGDARGILKLTKKARAAVVVGGGITALELVEGLRARGLKVHYFLRRNRYWGNVLDETESKIIEHRLTEEGVRIHYHTELETIEGRRGRVSAVETKAGEKIPCGMVAIAIGIRPRLDLAKIAGLKTDRGILVDEFLQTSHPRIYAAGDVAQVYDPASGRSGLDSLWAPARGQGRLAGLNMAGSPSEYRKDVPYNVTRLAGLTTTIIGTVGGGEDLDLQSIARGDSETWRKPPDAMIAQNHFDVNRLRLMVGEKRFLGAIVMGDQSLSRPLYHLVARKADIRPIKSRMLELDVDLKELIGSYYTFWKSSD